MSDAARAAIGRPRSSHGIPVEIDPETTPAPQEPPPPSSVPGYETIPPAIRQQFELQARSVRELTEAFGKFWDLRKEAERLDRIEANLGTLAAATTRYETTLEKFVDPAIKQLMSSVAQLGDQLPRLSLQLETTSTLLTVVDGRMRTLEGDLRVMASEFKSARETSAQRHAEHTARLNDQDARIDKLERKDRDRDVISKALAKSERKKSGALGGIAGVIGYAIAAIIKHLFS
jgi:chromosome segregation ATPase